MELLSGLKILIRGYSKFSILKTSHCWVTPITFWTLIRLKNTILSLEHLESVLGEDLVKFLISIQKTQIFDFLPTQILCKELFWGPVPYLCLPWRPLGVCAMLRAFTAAPRTIYEDPLFPSAARSFGTVLLCAVMCKWRYRIFNKVNRNTCLKTV